MKVTKGEAGYIRKKKTTELVKVILEFGIVIALFVTGYVTTKDEAESSDACCGARLSSGIQGAGWIFDAFSTEISGGRKSKGNSEKRTASYESLRYDHNKL